MGKFLSSIGILGLLLIATAAAQAVSIDLVPVGNAGNATDPAYGDSYGSVGYVYKMGKYEITAGQYCEFLNAVARTMDPYGLYNTNMASYTKILREWRTNRYIYSVGSDWANRPVNWVSWGDAARFVNWLGNGEPNTGAEDLSTTEDGSYYLNGATSDAALLAVTRKANAAWVLPSDNEWYKAAYYDPNKQGGAGYWIYPTRSDSPPNNMLVNPDPGNHANFYDSLGSGNGDLTLGYPYYRTNVGEFENSAGAYGTFDQAGNIAEWSDTRKGFFNDCYGIIGGGYGSRLDDMESSGIGGGGYPTFEYPGIGLRVAYIPEPNGIILVCSAAIIFILWGIRRKTNFFSLSHITKY